jgi:hypothetical protein
MPPQPLPVSQPWTAPQVPQGQETQFSGTPMPQQQVPTGQPGTAAYTEQWTMTPPGVTPPQTPTVQTAPTGVTPPAMGQPVQPPRSKFAELIPQAQQSVAAAVQPPQPDPSKAQEEKKAAARSFQPLQTGEFLKMFPEAKPD